MERQSKVAKSESSGDVPNNEAPRKTKDGLLHVSELNRRMQELIGQYMLLEEYYMIESVKKVGFRDF